MKSKKLDISGGVVAQKLSRLHDAPKHLYGIGVIELEALLSRPCVAVVGTRLPTSYGVAVTQSIINDLVNHGVVIISGLALGTDCLAQQACLAAGGQTIAVLPSCVDEVYPRTNRPLAQKVAEQGMLVSEYAEGGTPRKDQFLARNRIIAALSDVVLIPEAAERSGSLHTANFALEMGIPVMAVPGNITSIYSGGPNKLIATGATPVLSAADILRELKITAKTSEDYVPETEAEAKLLNAMRRGNQDGAAIKQASGLESSLYLQTLTMLEIKGIIAPLGGDQWRVL